MTLRTALSGALALPVVIGLALVEPALGLVVGFAVFAAAERLPAPAHRLRLSRRGRPSLRRPRSLGA